MNDSTRELLRRIPKMDRLLADAAVLPLVEQYGRAPVAEALRIATDHVRDQVLGGDGVALLGEDPVAGVRALAERRLRDRTRRSLRRAINATGVVLHTGLGRAVLAEAAADAVREIAANHSLLEVDAESGERGSRQAHVAALLRELTGAEDGLVVNNNAAAVLLAISVMAAGREVIISRGQLVEIGGSFRIPDVIRSGGARLVEVGTTNKARLRDYADAITENTALILRVHPSNFRIIGFTEEVELSDLVALGRERGIPVLDDLGSGALVDLTRYGLVAEPTVHASVQADADVITFSGDKLLGGPQGGLVVGKKGPLQQMKRHPLMRALRVDKMTLAALEATLRLYRDEAGAMEQVPTLRALTATPDVLADRARRLAEQLADAPLDVELVSGISQVGGGALPGEQLPTTLVAIDSPAVSATELARRLRTGEPSVWGRIQRDRLLFDPRTVGDDELPELAAAIRAAVSSDR